MARSSSAIKTRCTRSWWTTAAAGRSIPTFLLPASYPRRADLGLSAPYGVAVRTSRGEGAAMVVAVAVALALVAAIMFAVAAVAQNTAIIGVVADRAQALRAAEFRGLARSRIWLCGVGLTAVASAVPAGALALAPAAVVQPIGALSVPIAIVLAAWR